MNISYIFFLVFGSIIGPIDPSDLHGPGGGASQEEGGRGGRGGEREEMSYTIQVDI